MKYFRDSWTKDYAQFPEKLRLEMLDETRQMFTFGYDSYMKYAFPLDELDPIHCTGRGPDYENPSNININDVLGDYSLGTLMQGPPWLIKDHCLVNLWIS